MMRHTVFVSAVLLVAAVAGARVIAADGADPAERKAEARAHFEKGTLRFDEARYEEAIEHFEAAFEITGAAEILYNIGRCHEELGRTDAAVSFYERYLERQGDAGDAAEVRERIDRLRPGRPATDADTDERADAGALSGTLLGVTLGAAFPITGEWNRVMVPFAAVLHLPFLDWLFFTGSVGFAGFAGEEPKTSTGYPTGAVDLMVGLTGFRSLSERFSLFGTIGVGNVFLFRDHHKTAYWLDPRIALGLAIHFFESWSVTVEATGSYGPVFVAKQKLIDPWADPPGPTADAGGRVGISYAF